MNNSRKPDPENSQTESSATVRRTILATAPLPEHISQSIDAIIALHTRNEQHVPQHQRVVEGVTTFFGYLKRKRRLWCSIAKLSSALYN